MRGRTVCHHVIERIDSSEGIRVRYPSEICIVRFREAGITQPAVVGRNCRLVRHRGQWRLALDRLRPAQRPVTFRRDIPLACITAAYVWPSPCPAERTYRFIDQAQWNEEISVGLPRGKCVIEFRGASGERRTVAGQNCRVMKRRTRMLLVLDTLRPTQIPSTFAREIPLTRVIAARVLVDPDAGAKWVGEPSRR